MRQSMAANMAALGMPHSLAGEEAAATPNVHKAPIMPPMSASRVDTAALRRSIQCVLQGQFGLAAQSLKGKLSTAAAGDKSILANTPVLHTARTPRPLAAMPAVSEESGASG